ncbi:uncharacterized protein PV07_04533 [Cladophialophora immunda]|uniref:Uncharacterized protein n=1 Tax=Cladophialophora immunda TaxID=569365 RepID=A0A0D1ZY87_9EURO|nr:uncharacterized protein PV07_04533 [Cladophialophora immunda]KIW33031.1 hypothetical protein PV07_04533 [Cladophialophora immunda]
MATRLHLRQTASFRGSGGSPGGRVTTVFDPVLGTARCHCRLRIPNNRPRIPRSIGVLRFVANAISEGNKLAAIVAFLMHDTTKSRIGLETSHICYHPKDAIGQKKEPYL